ncbi:DHH family phosphoesterase [Bacillus suaedae]|uniref:Oligoribonuclease n=1 Tax=Halalkalibacter suaedae TaxID=2822140 RepID=A0A941ARQ5_9BACI|nr:oligoribonuclease [Bacillus suaedae]MBP3953068.1 oligoribonuclease [Bacillus suaedae]
MYHVYSHNDLDGVSCGIIARIAFGANVTNRYNSVQGLDLQVERYLEKAVEDDHLFITDLSVNKENEERIESFIKKGGNVTLIDHHKTALHLNDYTWGNVTVAYPDGHLACATSLLYDYLVEHYDLEKTNALNEFVDLVRQWDTWEWDQNKTMNAKRLNDLFYMLSIDEFEERMVRRLTSEDSFSFDEFEEKLLDMEETKIERYIKRKRRELVQTFIGDYCVGIVHAESYHSELGNVLGKDCPHLDYITILNLGGKKMSFRTIHDEVDVSAVAAKFNGGGHVKAAGATLTEEAYKLFIATPFSIEPLRVDALRNQFNIKESKLGSLYRSEDKTFYIYPASDKEWVLEENKVKKQTYPSFAEAENNIKRYEKAWLVRDDQFIHFIRQTMIEGKKS